MRDSTDKAGERSEYVTNTRHPNWWANTFPQHSQSLIQMQPQLHCSKNWKCPCIPSKNIFPPPHLFLSYWSTALFINIFYPISLTVLSHLISCIFLQPKGLQSFYNQKGLPVIHVTNRISILSLNFQISTHSHTSGKMLPLIINWSLVTWST